jgi:hypothetical protein
MATERHNSDKFVEKLRQARVLAAQRQSVSEVSHMPSAPVG